MPAIRKTIRIPTNDFRILVALPILQTDSITP